MKPRYAQMFSGAIAVLLVLLILGVPIKGQTLLSRLSRGAGVAMNPPAAPVGAA